jgi:hypothetical protein
MESQVMIDAVRDLVLLLLQDPLSVQDVTARVGSVIRDPGVPMTIELQPRLAGVRSASLSRYPESALPYVLTLEFKRGDQPTVAELKSVFGDYSRTLTDRGQPITIVFPPSAASHWRVVMFAELESGGVLDDCSVATIALRRDPMPP